MCDADDVDDDFGLNIFTQLNFFDQFVILLLDSLSFGASAAEHIVQHTVQSEKKRCFFRDVHSSLRGKNGSLSFLLTTFFLYIRKDEKKNASCRRNNCFSVFSFQLQSLLRKKKKKSINQTSPISRLIRTAYVSRHCIEQFQIIKKILNSKILLFSRRTNLFSPPSLCYFISYVLQTTFIFFCIINSQQYQMPRNKIF